MFRKRRRPTPGFGIPSPYNPIQGENANLRQDGVSPFCAMMQVAEHDRYENYVICRGFDPRILKFVDYAEGDPNKLGVCVAKPFGCRKIRKYRIGEVYPAFLPTQGNTDFAGFREVTYVPPSPVDVHWRLGQNPGYATVVKNGGHAETLVDSIESLVDHNGRKINWMLIHSANEQFFRFQSLEDLAGDSCAATIRRMDRSGLRYETIYDPDNLFEGMEAGTYGRAFYQENRFFIIQAKCEPDEIDLTDYEEEF
jgi:hypothetical protein